MPLDLALERFLPPANGGHAHVKTRGELGLCLHDVATVGLVAERLIEAVDTAGPGPTAALAEYLGKYHWWPGLSAAGWVDNRARVLLLGSGDTAPHIGIQPVRALFRAMPPIAEREEYSGYLYVGQPPILAEVACCGIACRAPVGDGGAVEGVIRGVAGLDAPHDGVHVAEPVFERALVNSCERAAAGCASLAAGCRFGPRPIVEGCEHPIQLVIGQEWDGSECAGNPAVWRWGHNLRTFAKEIANPAAILVAEPRLG